MPFHGRPVVSGSMPASSAQPMARLMFCIACVAAPFNRLSSVATITTRLPSADNIVDHHHQWLGLVSTAETLKYFLARHLARQIQIGGDRESAEMRCHVRHELYRHAESERRLLLMHVACERVWHQVVTQLVWIVLVRRRGAGTGITGHAEAHRRRGEQILQRCDRQLHRGGIATGIADALLAVPLVAGQLR